MAETTNRHGLPLLQAGQAQKEVTHNEALVLLDLLAHPAVEDMLATPPAAPTAGQSWIVDAAATGAWAGQDGTLACRTGGGWRFLAAQAGMLVWNKASGGFVWFDGAQWQSEGWPVPAPQTEGMSVAGQAGFAVPGSAVPEPVGGATVDSEARVVIGQILAVLRTHGLIAT